MTSSTSPLAEITNKLDSRIFFDAALTRWRWIALAVVICPTVGIIYATLSAPYYTARATVKVESQVSLSRILDEGPAPEWELNSQLPVVMTVIQSRPVVRRILLQLGELSETDDPLTVDIAVARFHSRVRVFTLPGGIVEISFRSEDPDVVVQTLHMLIDELKDAMLRPKQESLDASVEFLATQLDRIREELDEGELAIEEFQAESDTQRPEVYEATLEHYSALLGEYTSTQSDLAAADQELVVARDRLQAYDSEARDLEDRLESARRHYNSLMRDYTDDHPEVVSARLTVEGRQEALDNYRGQGEALDINDFDRLVRQTREGRNRELLQGELSAYRDALSEAEGQRERVALIRSQLDETLASLSAFSANEQALNQMLRDVEAKSTVYSRLLAQYEDALVNRELTLQTEGRQVWVIEQPGRTDPPEKQKLGRKVAAITSLFFALIAALGAIIVAEFLDRTVRVPSEAERLTELPLIGVLPPLDSA